MDLKDNQLDKSLMTIPKKYIGFQISFEYLMIVNNLFLKIKEI